MNLKGRIVLVRYPFDDAQSDKVRPALCLTDAVGPFAHVIVAYFTSRILAAEEMEPFDIIIDPVLPQNVGCGLKVVSTLRLHRVFTADALLMIRTLGQLPANLQTEVEDKLRSLLRL